ncbi:MAG: cyclic nucleotide-binding domain-containing protein [Bacteriovoracaceae bacterium]|jgi:CRP-like cAMP-binding protein|nr:cyclic nucleotide-binding domain-containing protein [Bacteriovoracaceae bacterium]
MEKVIRTLKDGEILMNEGEKATEMYYVQSGTLQASKKSGDNELIVLGTITEKEFVGEMSFFKEIKRTATVTALGDVQVVVFAFDIFQDMLGALPPWYNSLVTTLVSRLKDVEEKLVT